MSVPKKHKSCHQRQPNSSIPFKGQVFTESLIWVCSASVCECCMLGLMMLLSLTVTKSLLLASMLVCSPVCLCVAFVAVKPKQHACSCPVHDLQVLCNAQTSVPNALACGSTSPDLQTASTPIAIAALAAMGMGQHSTGRHVARYSTLRKPSRCLPCASSCANLPVYLCQVLHRGTVDIVMMTPH